MTKVTKKNKCQYKIYFYFYSFTLESKTKKWYFSFHFNRKYETLYKLFQYGYTCT